MITQRFGFGEISFFLLVFFLADAAAIKAREMPGNELTSRALKMLTDRLPNGLHLLAAFASFEWLWRSGVDAADWH